MIHPLISNIDKENDIRVIYFQVKTEKHIRRKDYYKTCEINNDVYQILVNIKDTVHDCVKIVQWGDDES